ncbi:MAG TPA: hypothetical protein VHQ65_05140 [Thermoanaerobaculia bacterium]|nr:hypothetical protein [Thermoanaerobaculia bacterium]
MKYLPNVPLAVAVMLAAALAGAEDAATRQSLTGWVAILLGLALALSGIKAIVRGRVLMRTRDAVRDQQPVAFWITVVVFRFAVAAVLLGVGAGQLL